MAQRCTDAKSIPLDLPSISTEVSSLLHLFIIGFTHRTLFSHRGSIRQVFKGGEIGNKVTGVCTGLLKLNRLLILVDLFSRSGGYW